jgi:hypothetical protein
MGHVAALARELKLTASDHGRFWRKGKPPPAPALRWRGRRPAERACQGIPAFDTVLNGGNHPARAWRNQITPSQQVEIHY